MESGDIAPFSNPEESSRSDLYAGQIPLIRRTRLLSPNPVTGTQASYPYEWNLDAVRSCLGFLNVAAAG